MWLSKLDNALGLVSKVLAGFACLAALALTVFVLLSAIMRYFIGVPFHFTEDIVSLLFLATAFLSIPITAHQRSYIRISILSDMLPRKLERLTGVLGSIVFLVFVIWFAIVSYNIASFSHQIRARTETAEIPVALWQAIMPFSMTIVALICLLQLIELVRGLIDGNEDSTPEKSS